MTDAFAAWDAFLGPAEGGLSLDEADPGNWSGGHVGVGELRGTKYGISAAAHPNLDIAHLTLADARKLRRTEYWDAVRGDELPPPVAFMIADAAYVSGARTAIRHLQATVLVPADGILGDQQSLPAIRRAVTPAGIGLDELLVTFCSYRLTYLAGLQTWPRYGLGWSRRLLRGLLIARSLTVSSSSTTGPVAETAWVSPPPPQPEVSEADASNQAELDRIRAGKT